jgi:outer membrane beta-barrel protein
MAYRQDPQLASVGGLRPKACSVDGTGANAIVECAELKAPRKAPVGAVEARSFMLLTPLRWAVCASRRAAQFLPIALLVLLVPTAVAAEEGGQDGAQPAPAAAAADSEAVAEGAEEAEAGEDEQQKTLQDRIRAVSRRVFLKRQRFELVPHAGLTTNDPFVRAYPLGLRGSWHFNEEFALDFGGSFVPPFFVQELQDVRLLSGDAKELNPARENSAVLIATLDGGVTFSPFYGKFALMAEHVVHFDGFISAGLGAVFTTGQQLVNPALELGVGTRLFLMRWLTVRADLRNYLYPSFAGDDLSFPSTLLLTVGVGIHIPFDFDYSAEVIGSKE